MYCGRKLEIRYLHVDHKNPLKNGGSNGVGNLQVLCGPCNSRKGSMTDGEFRRLYGLTPARQAGGPPTKAIPQSYFDEIAVEVKARKRARAKRQRDAWSLF